VAESSAKVVPLVAGQASDAYGAARLGLTERLVRYTLFESWHGFARHGMPFPFIQRTLLLPNTGAPVLEHPYQNTAFMVMIDGALPRALVKHFRLRQSNRVTWSNIQQLAPHLDVADYRADHCQFSSPEIYRLLTKLSTLDYALLIQRPDGEAPSPSVLTHMHVKVERLTDNAIKDLGKALGYIDRRLFERGEDYVDALEAKFFEYYGFSANASGRKSAAAMAAQLLSGRCPRFSVFVAAQDDCRLTVLDESDRITQYLLIRLEGAAAARLRTAAAAAGDPDLEVFSLFGSSAEQPIVLYRLGLRRTSAARPGKGQPIDRSLSAPWLEIADEAVLPDPDLTREPLPFAWATAEAD
jgi:hypothetical protein